MATKDQIILPVYKYKKKEGKLSPREFEIINLLSSGLTHKEVASILFISAETVKRHCTNMREKTGLKTTLAIAVRVARKQAEEQYRNCIVCSD